MIMITHFSKAWYKVSCSAYSNTLTMWQICFRFKALSFFFCHHTLICPLHLTHPSVLLGQLVRHSGHYRIAYRDSSCEARIMVRITWILMVLAAYLDLNTTFPLRPVSDVCCQRAGPALPPEQCWHHPLSVLVIAQDMTLDKWGPQLAVLNY